MDPDQTAPKPCGPRSDCSCRSSLIWVYTVCLYASVKIDILIRRSDVMREEERVKFSSESPKHVVIFRECVSTESKSNV